GQACDALPRFRSQLDVVFREIFHVPLFLHLGARDAATVPLRPADADRLEGAHPVGDCKPGGDRDREGGIAVRRMGEAIAFYFLSACILGFAVLVITTRDTVHSVLFLVLDFLFVAALYVLLGAQ